MPEHPETESEKLSEVIAPLRKLRSRLPRPPAKNPAVQRGIDKRAAAIKKGEDARKAAIERGEKIREKARKKK